jgi:trehalose 6-phosphate phosphatase
MACSLLQNGDDGETFRAFNPLFSRVGPLGCLREKLMSTACAPPELPCPSVSILHGASLFLDFDGTLVDIAERPDAVFVEPELRDLLRRLGERLEGRIALISGRSIAQIDRLLGPDMAWLAISGSHGSEHRWQGVSAQPARPPALDRVAQAFRHFSERHPGTLAESKSFGVALHYRMAPRCEAEARCLARELADETGLAVQNGHLVVELRMPGTDKGTAVRRLMHQPPMLGTRPVFVGDDLTDEAAFEAAKALGGVAVLVGPNRPTAATFSLSGPGAVRRWLADYVR